MLSDLNTILYNIVKVKQEFRYYTAAAEECKVKTTAVQCFLLEAFTRVSLVELHKLVGFAAGEFFSLWNFWNRLESRYYGEPPVSKEALDSWRNSLHTWNIQIETVRELREGKAGHHAPLAAPRTLTLKEMDDMLHLIETLVLGMLNPVLQFSLAHDHTSPVNGSAGLFPRTQQEFVGKRVPV